MSLMDVDCDLQDMMPCIMYTLGLLIQASKRWRFADRSSLMTLMDRESYKDRGRSSL